MPSKSKLRQQWNNAGKDVVVLHQFFRARHAPNGSPFPIKLETYLRIAKIDYEFRVAPVQNVQRTYTSPGINLVAIASRDPLNLKQNATDL